MGDSCAVYVDGYNFYYGRLRGTPYKWIDLVALFDRLLQKQDPACRIEVVNYFSAFCLAKFATNGPASPLAQDRFLRAHTALHGTRFSRTMGTHTHDRTGTSMPRYVAGKPYDRRDRVKVWKLEEKQTDVNIALAMYRDACSGAYTQQIICSNDSDVVPVLRAIKQDFPHIRLGVVTPRRPPEPDITTHRNVMSSLSAVADWTRGHIDDEELAASQLPIRVQTGKRPIDKPDHW
ncbi:NYN domain-containing protein [Stenotrophomonas sp. 278]|uniref:NYN domain-containing protein n=1 Tax=Stenotrophomonas sp. 278 TaxID=2479851 RepID=UPI000F690BD2|nr:NYN domain-containing protein [Stenotrophomonas sp. 278]RRT97866.1 NYN domain-containing protein [Stenotrophomonas sp. 278]